MTTPAISLLDTVISAINSAASKSILRRYVPSNEIGELKSGLWQGFLSKEDFAKKRRVDIVTTTIGLVYQRSLPAAATGAPNPLAANDFIDACMDEVESVKVLFREDGSLAEKCFGDAWSFQGMRNDPIYNPNLLKDNQLFASVLLLDFLAE